LLIILIGAILLAGCSSQTAASPKPAQSAEQDGKLRAMNDAAGEVYKLTKEGKYKEARDQLQQFTNLMTKVSYQGVTTADGLSELTSLVVEARGVFTQVKFSPEQGLLAAAKLRLAADALTNRESPMWLEYRKVFRADAERLGLALKDKDIAQATAELQVFQQHYRLIRPAVMISTSAALVEKLDSWFIFMHGLLTQPRVDFKKANAGIMHTDELIAELFGGTEREAIVPPSPDSSTIAWASVLSAIIIAVLAYVGWRKYNVMGKTGG